MSFDLNYADSPWGTMNTNQREWYDPELRKLWRNNVIYQRLSTLHIDTKGLPTSNSLEVTSLIMPHPDFSTIGFRDMWAESGRVDTQARTVSVQRYGRKMAYHKHDALITYWKQNGKAGLLNIVNQGLGYMMVEIMETLTRNAFLSNSAYSTYGNGGQSNFNEVDAFAKRLSTGMADDIQLGLQTRGVPFTQRAGGGVGPGSLICLTTPGAIRDIVHEASATGNSTDFIDAKKYTGALPNEVGTYRGIRYVATNRALLHNVGPVIAQPTIAAAHKAGDGVNRSVLVDGVWKVGQKSGILNYIQLSSVDDLAVGDVVSFHIDRTSDFGVSNGADYRDGTKQERRIVSIDSGTNRIVIDKPLGTDFDVDLGSGVYGYLTKGRHIHASLFTGSEMGVVQAVLQPPRIYTPPPVDDFESIYRISFDMSEGFHLWEPEVFEVHFGAGSYRWSGKTVR